ncbi:hypothetical protein [Cohnella sp.]|uniref:hypothetical protein n=1 Tax=Cohnella sp. TaxID=1883426 RepID=UPI00356B04FB
MSEHHNNPAAESSEEPKKLSQADAIKRILEQKKAKQQGSGQQGFQGTETKKMRSQINKKPNNQKKRTGV